MFLLFWPANSTVFVLSLFWLHANALRDFVHRGHEVFVSRMRYLHTALTMSYKSHSAEPDLSQETRNRIALLIIDRIGLVC